MPVDMSVRRMTQLGSQRETRRPAAPTTQPRRCSIASLPTCRRYETRSTASSPNFAAPGSQHPEAYAEQMIIDHIDLDRATLLADAVIAVETFHDRLFPS